MMVSGPAFQMLTKPDETDQNLFRFFPHSVPMMLTKNP